MIFGIGQEYVAESIPSHARIAGLFVWFERTWQLHRVHAVWQPRIRTAEDRVGEWDRIGPGRSAICRVANADASAVGSMRNVRHEYLIRIGRIRCNYRRPFVVADAAKTGLIDQRRRQHGRDCPVFQRFDPEAGSIADCSPQRRGSEVLLADVAKERFEVHIALTRSPGPTGRIEEGPGSGLKKVEKPLAANLVFTLPRAGSRAPRPGDALIPGQDS